MQGGLVTLILELIYLSMFKYEIYFELAAYADTDSFRLYKDSLSDKADVVINALFRALRQMAQKTLVAHK